MKTLYMIGGTMGVGKTAVSRALKRQPDRAVLFFHIPRQSYEKASFSFSFATVPSSTPMDKRYFCAQAGRSAP